MDLGFTLRVSSVVPADIAILDGHGVMCGCAPSVGHPSEVDLAGHSHRLWYGLGLGLDFFRVCLGLAYNLRVSLGLALGWTSLVFVWALF